MTNFLVTSFLIHFVLIAFLFNFNASSGTSSIEVEIREKRPPAIKSGRSTYIRKPLKSHKSNNTKSGELEKKNTPDENVVKKQDVTYEDYAQTLKTKVDPIWVRNVEGLTKHHQKYFLEVLLLIDKRGNIISSRVITPSGYSNIDECAIATFREVATLPVPAPEQVYTKGIIWEFSNF